MNQPEDKKEITVTKDDKMSFEPLTDLCPKHKIWLGTKGECIACFEEEPEDKKSTCPCGRRMCLRGWNSRKKEK